MSHYELTLTWLAAMVSRVTTDAREDDRGITVAETVVMIGVALVAAGVIGGILWSKLKGGAENVNVESPTAP